jgi:hypothetical protein
MRYLEILAHVRTPVGQTELALNRARRAVIDLEIELELRKDAALRYGNLPTPRNS